ncbi:MAG: hypothetical protein ACREL7_15645 [Longimicrobiales bacterium]
MPGPRFARRRDRDSHGSLVIGLAGSAVVHLLLFQLAFTVPVAEQNPGYSAGNAAFVRSSSRLLNIAPERRATASAAIPVARVRLSDPSVRTDSVTEAVIARDAWSSTAASGRTSLYERLRPRSAPDAFLIKPDRSLVLEPALATARSRIAGTLDSYNDSVATAEESANRAAHWTHEDSDGGHWGISTARIHLGSFTWALHYDTTENVFQPPADRRDEYRRRIRSFNEIQQQVLRAEIASQMQSSLRAIRTRVDARRDSIRSSGR